MQEEEVFVDCDGIPLSGEELESYCKRHGLCHLCARERTHKRVFKLLHKNKWQALTVKGGSGDYNVYKGYCVRPGCFTLDQAKRLLGEVTSPSPTRTKTKGGEWTPHTSTETSLSSDIRRSDDDVSVGSSMTSNSSAKRSLHQLLSEHAGTVLDLSSTRLHHVHITELVSSLIVAKSLHTLILENCHLNDNELEMIAVGLFKAREAPLQRLSLRTNQVGNRGACSLYDWLQDNTSLQELDLSKNQIGSKGANTVLQALGDNPRTKIRMVNFSHNEIWEIGDESFFATNKSLQVLNLEGNFIHDEGIEATFQGIAANDKTALERLFLGWNGLGDDAAANLANMLERNTSLQTLGLGENDISNTGARAILSAMAVNTTLREITGLYHNQIDRKFIIVAIKRLLVSHIEDRLVMKNPNGRLTEIMEESMSVIEEPLAENPGPPGETSESSLDWADKLYAPGEDDKPPIVVINTGSVRNFESTLHHKDCSCDSCIQNELSKSKEFLKERRPSVPPLNVKTAAAAALKQWDWGTNGDSTSRDIERPLRPAPPPQTNLDRLRVFQMAPLAYFNRDTTMHHAVPLHDFDYETNFLRNALKESERIGGQIEVEIETATKERLESFISRAPSRIMHISGHGHPESLALESGLGYIESVPVDDFVKLVEAGGGKLKLAFVTSCHSRMIGKALLDAGVPHVVCCHHAETFRDLAAMAFTQNFYRALAVNNTLKQAFDMAREAVRVEEITKHVDRFHLLPKMEDASEYHEVPIFFTEEVSPTVSVEDDLESWKILPEVPQYFMGREVDMYEILEALRVDDVVRVGGPQGSGKTSLVAAVGRYIRQRRKLFQFDDIFWLPPITGFTPDKDSLHGDLCESVAMMIRSDRDIWEDEDAMECRERIEIELEGQRTMLVIDGRQFKTESASQNLEHFLSHLLNAVNVKIILVNDNSKPKEPSEQEDTIQLGPLDFKSTSLLFGEVSRFITGTGCPAAQSPEEFAALMVPPSVAKLQDQSKFFSRRRRDLMACMGNGIPDKVIKTAKEMTPNIFIQLIGIANSPEVQVESYGALEMAHSHWSMQKKMAVNSKNYLRAYDIDKLLRELDSLRPNFPSLDDLLGQERNLKDELAETMKSKHYEAGNNIKKQLLVLKRQIMQEKRAKPENKQQTVDTDRLAELQAKMKAMLAMADQSLSDLDHNASEHVSATFDIGSAYHRCFLSIYYGSVVDFDPEPDAGAVVCWTNESCDLSIEASGKLLMEMGGPRLVSDVKSLPAIARTPWGLAKCGTGNACIVGPGDYGDLLAPCIVLAVGPLCASGEDECDLDEEDRLHYIEIMMRSCVRSSLVLAKHSQLQAVAFPTLTTKFGGETYDLTLRMGLRTLVEEAKYSDLSNLHIVASSDDEASKLISMALKLGLQYAS